jgi:hypothetical protein
MTSLLLEMLASRSGGNTNPALAEMIAKMRSAPGDGAQAISPELLSQLAAGGNPMYGLLAKHFAQAQARPVVIDVESESVSSYDTPAEEPHGEAPDPAMSELRAHTENMFAELSQLRERMDELAAALGACCLCWGRDRQCRNCRGRGGPGFSNPDQALFEELVLPAIRNMRAQTAIRKPVSPTLQSQTPVGQRSDLG